MLRGHVPADTGQPFRGDSANLRQTFPSVRMFKNNVPLPAQNRRSYETTRNLQIRGFIKESRQHCENLISQTKARIGYLALASPPKVQDCKVRLLKKHHGALPGLGDTGPQQQPAARQESSSMRVQSTRSPSCTCSHSTAAAGISKPATAARNMAPNRRWGKDSSSLASCTVSYKA